MTDTFTLEWTHVIAWAVSLVLLACLILGVLAKTEDDPESRQALLVFLVIFAVVVYWLGHLR